MKPTRLPPLILMAEDDPDDRLLLRLALEDARVASELRFVSDGEELMDYLRRRGAYREPSSSPRPGVIFLDLNMPRKDGREVLREMKTDSELRAIPVVVLTTSRAEEDVRASYGLGANSFVTKPSTYHHLLDVVSGIGRYWLEIVELPHVSDV